MTAPQYSDTNVTNCLNYFYTVTAQDNYGFESPFSSEVSANPGPQAVMKLIAGIGVKMVGAYVSNWQDQAKSNDAKQSVAESRPIWAWSAINGRPAVDFFGADKHLDVADSADINTGGCPSATCPRRWRNS